MIIWYKNSFWASVVSIFGCGMIMCGIAIIMEGEILPAICLIAIGVLLFIWARKISQNKALKKWWKELEKKGIIAQAATDKDLAIAIYRKEPRKWTLRAIRKLNPSAAAAIENKSAPASSAPQPKAVPQPQPKAAPQPQPKAAPQPQPKAAPQPQPRQSAPAQAAPSAPESIMQQAMAQCDRNSAKDPKVYLQAVNQLEALYREHPFMTGLRGNLARAHTDYSASIQQADYEQRKQGAQSALRALELEPEAPADVLDKRVFRLLLNTLVMSILAANSTGTREQMISAHNMLRNTSRYYIRTPNETEKQLMGISIPAARCRIAYSLSRNLSRKEPVKPQEAAALAQEALRFCPLDSIRQCDINPYTKDNTTVLLTRQDIQNLIKQLQ